MGKRKGEAVQAADELGEDVAESKADVTEPISATSVELVPEAGALPPLPPPPVPAPPEAPGTPEARILTPAVQEQIQAVAAASVPPPSIRPEAPQGLTLEGRYRIDTRLGVGGVGAVYAGTQLALGRKVAVKLLHEGLDPSFRARFEREAKALASLRHPNVVSVTDFGVDEQTPYLVMELLDGETLAERLARGRLLPEHAQELCRQLLRALAFVHEQGLVHRDLKPGNLFLELTVEGEERLKLLDFGLAKYIESTSSDAQTVTRAGHVVGTPAYMAPEQIAGDAVDARADIYATGVLLFQMITGHVPFQGEPMEQLRSHLIAEVPSLRASLPGQWVRPELMELIERAMKKKRDERFPDAPSMLAALEAIPQPWLTHAPILEARASQADGSGQGKGAGLLWVAAAGLSLVMLVMVSTGGNDPHDRSAPPHEAPGAASAPATQAKSATAAKALPTAPTGAAPATPAAIAATQAGANAVAGAAAPAALLPDGRPPPRNPWTKDTPTALRVIRKRVTQGERGDDDMIELLRKYNQSSEHDARGHLLLARMYLNRGWRDDALKQFALVYEKDPSARGAPLMLGDMLTLVADPKTSPSASRLVRDAYGREALPALDAMLMMPTSDPAASARLRALRTALVSGG